MIKFLENLLPKARKAKKQEIVKKLSLLEENLHNLQIILFKEEVTWKQVSIVNWKIGETKKVENTLNIKVFEEKNIIIFKTTIPPLSVFPEHWHSFSENNFVISGVYEDANGLKSAGEWIKYTPTQEHKVINPSTTQDLDIIVIFTKI